MDAGTPCQGDGSAEQIGDIHLAVLLGALHRCEDERQRARVVATVAFRLPAFRYRGKELQKHRVLPACWLRVEGDLFAHLAVARINVRVPELVVSTAARFA